MPRKKPNPTFDSLNLEGADSFLCDDCRESGYCHKKSMLVEPESVQVNNTVPPPLAPKAAEDLVDMLPHRVSFKTFATNDWPMMNGLLDAFNYQQYTKAIQLAETLMEKYDGWMFKLMLGLAAYNMQDYKKAYLHLSQLQAKVELNTNTANELKELLETCFVLQELEVSHHPKKTARPRVIKQLVTI